MTRPDGPPADPSPLEAALADPAASVVVDRSDGSVRSDGPDRSDGPGGARPVLVCFGGLSNGTDAAPYEFVRQTGDLGVHRVFVRDLGQCWYQRGLPGTADGVDGAVRHLSGVVGGLAPGRTVFVGNSSGAFAAVLFGVLCGADRIVAFGPQASVTRVGRLRSRDRRWPDQIRAARRHAAGRDHLDLVRLLRTRPHPGRIDVHHGERDRMDTRSAHRLGTVPGVTVTAHPGGHLFIRRLREAGTLLPLLDEAVGTGP